MERLVPPPAWEVKRLRLITCRPELDTKNPAYLMRMVVRGYNGAGRWSAEALVDPYMEYCRNIGLPNATALAPQAHSEGEGTWIYPVMDKVIEVLS